MFHYHPVINLTLVLISYHDVPVNTKPLLRSKQYFDCSFDSNITFLTFSRLLFIIKVTIPLFPSYFFGNIVSYKNQTS